MNTISKYATDVDDAEVSRLGKTIKWASHIIYILRFGGIDIFYEQKPAKKSTF